uniref:Cytochrome P450 n=1 Tax=Tetranychus urticae TaxID=32264 RepID=T1JYM8_TETUR
MTIRLETKNADAKDSCNYDANNNVNNGDSGCYYAEITCERKAFLDLLLEKHLQPSANTGKPIIDLEGVQEEINYLSLHTEVQDKIYAEINSILGDNIDDLSYNQIQKFNYLDQCIKEGLRLFPPVPMIARELDQEVILDGFKIPKGASVAIMIYTIHRDPIIYLHPDSFNPDRFDSDHISSIHLRLIQAPCVPSDLRGRTLKCWALTSWLGLTVLLPGTRTWRDSNANPKMQETTYEERLMYQLMHIWWYSSLFQCWSKSLHWSTICFH